MIFYNKKASLFGESSIFKYLDLLSQVRSVPFLVRCSPNVVLHAYKVVMTCRVLHNVTSNAFQDVSVRRDWYSIAIINAFQLQSVAANSRAEYWILGRLC